LKYADTVTKKDCVQREKYDLISLLQYFPPSAPSVKVEFIAWPKWGKIKTQGEKISNLCPQLDFCALFSLTIKIIGEKHDIMSPIARIFFRVSHNFMKHCMI
jgi:hypothetical protein